VKLSRRQAFGIAAVIALVVAGLVYFVLTQQARRPAPESQEMVTVLVASQDIPSFTPVSAEMVGTKEVAAGEAPRDALTTAEQAIGRIAQAQVRTGDVLTRTLVAPRSADAGLTFVIPPGMRAVTVALDPISGVGGFVFPNDRVDVLVTFQQGDVAITKTILQNVMVLAINEETSRPKPARTTTGAAQGEGAEAKTESTAPATEQVKSATLAVTPDEAQQLILSAFKGAVHLVLRPRDDESIVSLAGQSDFALMGLEAPEGARKEPEEREMTQAEMIAAMGWPPGYAQPPGQAAAAAPAPQPAPEPAETVEVIRGNTREVVTPQ